MPNNFKTNTENKSNPRNAPKTQHTAASPAPTNSTQPIEMVIDDDNEPVSLINCQNEHFDFQCWSRDPPRCGWFGTSPTVVRSSSIPIDAPARSSSFSSSVSLVSVNNKKDEDRESEKEAAAGIRSVTGSVTNGAKIFTVLVLFCFCFREKTIELLTSTTYRLQYYHFLWVYRYNFYIKSLRVLMWAAGYTEFWIFRFFVLNCLSGGYYYGVQKPVVDYLILVSMLDNLSKAVIKAQGWRTATMAAVSVSL